ncbi:MAG: PTS sugar transporter subunit IIA [Phycisphaerae bacterium]|jgi:mannitol/fructose-specific phosphotransferase system IIA component (Ntr-type)
MKLLDLIHPKCIIAELQSTDRNGVIRELVGVLATAELIDTESCGSIAKAIITRETRGTTGFGKGVAAPHGKVDGLSRVMAAIGRSSRGIDFSSLDGEPVFGVLLLLSPTERTEEHLRAMDLIWRLLQQERFRRFLRQSTDAAKIYDLLKEADEKLLVS